MNCHLYKKLFLPNSPSTTFVLQHSSRRQPLQAAAFVVGLFDNSIDFIKRTNGLFFHFDGAAAILDFLLYRDFLFWKGLKCTPVEVVVLQKGLYLGPDRN